MSVKLFISIDAEEDNWGEYRPTGHTVENIDRLPIIQDLFERYGAVPTYLLNYPVVKNGRAARIILDILDKGRCEIGVNCHPWNTPPFEEKINIRNTMLCNLPYEVLHNKIETLHKTIIDVFRVIPTCFRAGRWGLGPEVARCIHKLGYQIDSSITPYFDWVDSSGPDFWQAPCFPYRFSPANILAELWNGCLLEVPPTIGFLQKNLKLCSSILKWILCSHLSWIHLIGILDRLRIINRRWLSPELSCSRDMILLAKNLIKQGYSYLNMSFHSTTLLHGKSPFVRDEREFKSFLHNIEVFLEFAQKQGIIFAPLSEALEITNGAEERGPKTVREAI